MLVFREGKHPLLYRFKSFSKWRLPKAIPSLGKPPRRWRRTCAAAPVAGGVVYVPWRPGWVGCFFRGLGGEEEVGGGKLCKWWFQRFFIRIGPCCIFSKPVCSSGKWKDFLCLPPKIGEMIEFYYNICTWKKTAVAIWANYSENKPLVGNFPNGGDCN